MNNGTPVIDFASTEEYIVPAKNTVLFKATLAEQRKMIKKLGQGHGTGSTQSSHGLRTVESKILLHPTITRFSIILHRYRV